MTRCAFLLIGFLFLGGCSSATPEARLIEKFRFNVSAHCREISSKAILGDYYGACYRDFWNEYKKCFPWAISTSTGCVLMIGQVGKPECYPENCPEQWQ